MVPSEPAPAREAVSSSEAAITAVPTTLEWERVREGTRDARLGRGTKKRPWPVGCLSLSAESSRKRPGTRSGP